MEHILEPGDMESAVNTAVDVARRIGDRPEVVLKTYAHFLPGAGGKIAKRLDEMYR